MFSRTITTVFIFSFLCTSAFAAPNAPAGYDPDNDIEVPPEEVYMQQQSEDMKAMESQMKALQEAAEETEAIQLWEKMDGEIKLRRYDELVMEMKRSFDEAAKAANPFLGEQGYVIYPYGEVIPIITCRPMRMTDIALEPGESIMGIHAGDTVRWLFAPSQSMKNGLPVSHIVVKPSQPGISTNLLIHTDRRTYNLDFTSSEYDEYIRGAAFSYPMNDLTAVFTKNQPKKMALEDELQTANPDIEGLYTRYRIVEKNKKSVDWRPDAVFDDGTKTYIRMPRRYSETPAFYIVLDGKETLTNYRVKGRFYVVDRLFDRAVLKIGKRKVTIIREDTLSETNIRDNKREYSGGDNSAAKLQKEDYRMAASRNIEYILMTANYNERMDRRRGGGRRS